MVVSRLGTKDPMRPSSPSPLPRVAPGPSRARMTPRAPGARTASSTGPGGSGSGSAPSTALRHRRRRRRWPSALFVLCSGWFVDGRPAPTQPVARRPPSPSRWSSAAGRPCPSSSSSRSWPSCSGSSPGPALADVALLVALYTVAARRPTWVLVVAATVVLEAGVVMATVRWTPTGNDVKSFVFLTGLVFTALLAGVVVRALRSQLDWLAERRRAARARARPAGVSGRRGGAGPHRPRDARRGLAQHPGDGHPGRRRRRRAGARTPPGPPRRCTRCRAPAARR